MPFSLPQNKCRYFVLRNTKLSLLIILPLLNVAQLDLLRLQQVQLALSDATGSLDSDQKWTFGHNVAVAVFTPILKNFLCSFIQCQSNESGCRTDSCAPKRAKVPNHAEDVEMHHFELSSGTSGGGLENKNAHSPLRRSDFQGMCH